jgi:hypothetical protein
MLWTTPRPIAEGPVLYLKYHRGNDTLESAYPISGPRDYGQVYPNALVKTTGDGGLIVIPWSSVQEVKFAR